ncbi:peptide deformylase [Rubrivirga sp. S365]|uniref:Peptide deformylase n=1 Tax=Rubrivirga litoralis TaxID=3075598 RepID=A0ABU3BS14_9BACT|nr:MULTISPECIES: peptide deformylase [unclassified Rubrivirga]MDT0632080.1 peptide deformylase [Rubrivirga sp. F394]MDT7856158.1 peptide deformylase [Rubrivirga sp. S365]
MILPIYAYGQPVLRDRAAPIEADSPELQTLLDDMIETMRGANGAGLAAPQVGRALRVFVADLSSYADDLARDNGGEVPDYARGPLVLINPEIVVDEACDDVDAEEGCLSIPDLRETVWRPDRLRVRFLDRHFEPQELDAEGPLARVVQHELDHLDGVLYLDHLSPLRRRLLQRRLKAIARGDVETDYPLAFAE